MSRPLSRRTVLRAAGGITLSLPLLHARRAEAEGAQGFPLRFICLFHPNGTLPEKWWPTGGMSEDQFTLNTIHEPLEPWKDDLLILRGLDLKVANEGPGEPHQKGMGALLTGTSLQAGEFVGGDGSRAGWASGKSIDQHLAEQIGSDTKVGSLLLGVRCEGAEVRQRLSYLGAGAPVPPENDPRRVFESLFSDFAAPNPELKRIQSRRGSVLDGVTAQLEATLRRAGSEDRRKLDAHLTQLRDLERRLTATVMDTVGCARPEAPPEGLNPLDAMSMPEISRLQLDLLVTAMACDLTRVGVVQYSCALNPRTMPFDPVLSPYEGHYLSHLGGSDPRREEIERRDRWVAGELAYLMKRLSQVPEGEGSMLDHTVIFWGNELSVGNVHSQIDMPFVLAGRGGGLNTGRYLQFARRSHNDLLVSILNLMGLPDTTFGNPNYCSGPLSGLT